MLKVHDVGVRIVRDAGRRDRLPDLRRRRPGAHADGTAKLVREFLPRAELLHYLEAILRVYNLEGRRDNKFKARIKILVHEIGLDAFREQVEAEYAKIVAAAPAPDLREFARITRFFRGARLSKICPMSRASSNRRRPTIPISPRFVERNLFRHKKTGLCGADDLAQDIGEAPGDATAEQMRVVADLAEKYSFDEARVSYKQNLVLPHVRRDDVPEIFNVLKAHGLATANAELITDIICCPGLDYCALATARSIPTGANAVAPFRRSREAEGHRRDLDQDVRLHQRLRPSSHRQYRHSRAGEARRSRSTRSRIGGDPGDTFALGELLGPGIAGNRTSPKRSTG